MRIGTVCGSASSTFRNMIALLYNLLSDLNNIVSQPPRLKILDPAPDIIITPTKYNIYTQQKQMDHTKPMWVASVALVHEFLS